MSSSRPKRPTTTRTKWHRHRERAKRRGLETEIPFEDFEALSQITECRACSRELTFGVCNQPGAWSLDRLDASKGYVAGNISVLCLRCNRAKGRLTADELFALARFVEDPTIDY